MPDSKAKKPAATTKKIVDVKSEGDGATGNSRAIIVNNRPILKDPMMAQVSKLTGDSDESDHQSNKAKADALAEDAEQPEQKKATAKAPSATRTKIVPLSDEEKDETIKVKGVAHARESDKPTEDSSTDQPAKTEAESTGVASVPELPVDDEKTNVDAADTPEMPDTTVDTPVNTTEKPEAAAAETPTTDASADESAEGDEATPEAETKPDAALPGDTVSDDASAIQPGRSFDDTATSRLDASKQPEAPSVDGKAGPDEKKSNKPNYAQLSPEQEKAVESGEYFLPIKTAEGKRLRREIVIAVVVVVLLIIAWLDVMLDAGLISLGGLRAVTDFF